MGQPHTVEVDVSALRAVARHFDDAASSVDDIVRLHLGALGFDGAVGGRGYVAQADAVRNALTALVSAMTGWSRACAEVGVALRDGAARYVDAEAAGSDRLG